uniref:WGS project CAEQ00000000 data, annotated contig 303 n=1 Tax=Trypanosoma congolense (strain IL3000) TaxID=1068625 RepID=F9WEQ7_TRYCI|nr:unnamed protein product [Trypanosoma congolense IL3000]
MCKTPANISPPVPVLPCRLYYNHLPMPCLLRRVPTAVRCNNRKWHARYFISLLVQRSHLHSYTNCHSSCVIASGIPFISFVHRYTFSFFLFSILPGGMSLSRFHTVVHGSLDINQILSSTTSKWKQVLVSFLFGRSFSFSFSFFPHRYCTTKITLISLPLVISFPANFCFLTRSLRLSLIFHTSTIR